jgi:hypothetical protein
VEIFLVVVLIAAVGVLLWRRVVARPRTTGRGAEPRTTEGPFRAAFSLAALGARHLHPEVSRSAIRGAGTSGDRHDVLGARGQAEDVVAGCRLRAWPELP